MIDRFLGVLSVFYPASFGVLVCSVVLSCLYPQTTGPCSQWCPFLTDSVLVWLAHRRSVAVLCRPTLYKIRCNPMHPLYGAFPCIMCQCAEYTLPRTGSPLQNHAVPQDFNYILNVSVERSYWACIRWCGTGRFQEEGQCLLICLSCSLPLILLQFFLYLLSFYWLVLWGWGLRIDML